MKVLYSNRKKYSAKKHSVKKGLAKSKQSGGADFNFTGSKLRESAKNGDLENKYTEYSYYSDSNSEDYISE